ncbi:hypothetical protein ABPG75_012066 [Micractinium tetrahymenae]
MQASADRPPQAWHTAPQQAPQARPPSLPPSAGGGAPGCEVVARPSSMQDVQALLHDLKHRQEQQQAALPGCVLAVPAASATASPTKEEGDDGTVVAAGTPTGPAAAAARADTAVGPSADAGTALDCGGGPGGAAAAAAQQQQQPHGAAPVDPSSAQQHQQHPGAGALSSTAWMAVARAPPSGPTATSAPASGPPPVTVPLMSSAIAAMLAGSTPLPANPGGDAGQAASAAELQRQQSAAAPPAPPPLAATSSGVSIDTLAEQLSRLQQLMAAQATEQQRQLSYVQSMHHWASQVAASMRQLQKQSRAAAGTAAAAQEEAAGAKASLVQLAALQDSSMQQVCQLSLEVAELKEQMQLVLMDSGRASKPRRRGTPAAAGGGTAAQQQAAAAAQQQQQQQQAAVLHARLQQQQAAAAAQRQAAEAGLQPPSPKRMKVMPRVPTGSTSLAGAAGTQAGGTSGAPNGSGVPYYQLPYPAPLHLPSEHQQFNPACFLGAAK